MAGTLQDVLKDIRERLPKLFQKIIDDCKTVVENFENHLKNIEDTAKEQLLNLKTHTLSNEVQKRFEDDQEFAFSRFKTEIQDKLRKISEKALIKIRDENKKTQEIVNSIIEFQDEIRIRIVKYMDEHMEEPRKIIIGITEDIETYYDRYSKLRKETDKTVKGLPKKMDVIYRELADEIKKLETQASKNSNTIVEKYKRLIN